LTPRTWGSLHPIRDLPLHFVSSCVQMGAIDPYKTSQAALYGHCEIDKAVIHILSTRRRKTEEAEGTADALQQRPATGKLPETTARYTKDLGT